MIKGNTQRRKKAVRAKSAALLLCIAFLLSGCASESQSVESSFPQTFTASSTAQIISSSDKSTKKANIETKDSPNFCAFYDDAAFTDNIAAADPYIIDGYVSAAIVPHHAPHMDLLCSLLSSDAVQNAGYESVIVIGPNHTGNGKPIQITGRGYYWENGSIDGNEDAAAYLSGDFRLNIESDTKTLETDHAVSVLMPYIAQYLPDANITAILLSAAVTSEEMKNICEDFMELAKQQKTLLLFSIDFSHYQSPDDAARYDKETLDAILSGNIGKVLSWGNEHFDSPQSAALFLTFAEESGAQILCHDNRRVSFWENGILQAMSYFVFTAETIP